MNEFVEDCRREWKRLGVPDPVAEEMAAELDADLEEAEAEGVSAEEVLGSAAGDPRTFAIAWAAERGVIQQTPPNGRGLARRAGVIVATSVFALIAVIGGVLVIVASPSGPARLAFPADVRPALPGPTPMAVSPDGRTVAFLAPSTVRMAAPPPGDLRVRVDPIQPVPARLWISPVSTLPPAARIVAVDVNDSAVDIRTLGWVMLAVGLAGAVPLTMFWFFGRPAPGRRQVSL